MLGKLQLFLRLKVNTKNGGPHARDRDVELSKFLAISCQSGIIRMRGASTWIELHRTLHHLRVQIVLMSIKHILCFVNRAALYNLVNKVNLVHNLFLVYLSISTCFGRLCAHHQEKQLCLWDTWYLLFCVDDWYAYQIDKLVSILGINILRINCAPSWLYLWALYMFLFSE
jgi:hypothetical protein